MTDEFQRIMSARSDAWRPALTDPNPSVREFAETHVFGEFGFAARAQSVYLAAGMGDAGIREVYALLTQPDCPLLHAFESHTLYMALLPYFAAEFRAAPPWSLGWSHMMRAMPSFMAHGMRRMLGRKTGGFTPRSESSIPSAARFD
jgi:hypothetical protein